MKAVIKLKKGIDNIVYKDIPVPEINDDEVLIKVKAAGICGTDIHIYHDSFPYWPPVVLGHEFSGIIEKAGKNIKNFKIGERVTSEPHQQVCGLCSYCRRGLIHLCDYKRSPGWGINGAMAEYIKLPEKLLHRLPDNITFEEGAVIEPISTVTHALIDRGFLTPEKFVVVLGPGPIGLIAVQVCMAIGAENVVIAGTEEDEEHRLKIANELNIDHVINIDRTNLKDFIKNKTGNFGANVVVECSGSEKGINSAVDILCKNGKLIAMGMVGKEIIGLKWQRIIMKEINICTSLSSTYNSWEYAISLLASGKINIRKIISHKFPLTKYREAFDLIMRKKALKVILVPDGGRS